LFNIKGEDFEKIISSLFFQRQSPIVQDSLILNSRNAGMLSNLNDSFSSISVN